MNASHVYVSYQYPNLSEGADRVGGQLRGDKECPFSGVTKSGIVWRTVPESDARSVAGQLLATRLFLLSAAAGILRYMFGRLVFNFSKTYNVTSYGRS